MIWLGLIFFAFFFNFADENLVKPLISQPTKVNGYIYRGSNCDIFILPFLPMGMKS